MKKIKGLLSGLTILTLLSGYECSKKTPENPVPAIQLQAYQPTVPVLKGLASNPVLRVAVAIPAGAQAMQIQTINCELKATDLNDIEKLNVYLTGAEPFSAANLIASVTPSAAGLDIPVNLTCKPGLQFIWFSVVLKKEADIRHKISLICKSLVTGSGNEIPVPALEKETAHRIGVAVRKAGDDGVHTYRIPGIVQTQKGTLLAVYDIRYTTDRDLPGNIDVGMSRSTDGGNTWEPMKVIMDMGSPHENNGIGDPAILFDPVTGKVWVAALWSKGNRSIAGSMPGISPDTTGQLVLVNSADDGLTWSAPINITPQVKNPAWHLFFNGPGSGIAMHDGKLVFAAQYWDEKKMPHSTIIYSEDHGLTWKGKINGPKANTTEAQVAETAPGTLMLNMRDNRGSFRSIATTTDFGAHWIEHASSYQALRDPVCMGSLLKTGLKVKNEWKDIMLFSNPHTSSGRTHITIQASLDLGENWLPPNRLLIDERLCYGYSSLTRIDEQTVGMLYEGIRELYFVAVPITEIIK